MRVSLCVVLVFVGTAGAQPALEVGLAVGLPIHGPLVHGPLVAVPSAESCGTSAGAYCDVETVPLHAGFGVTATVGIARRLHLRLDATYQRGDFTENTYTSVYETTATSPLGIVATKISTTGSDWSFPLLLQWDIVKHVRVGLGPEASIVSDSSTLTEIRNPFTGYQQFAGNYFRRLDRAVIFGATVDVECPFRVGRMELAPDIHYTRWTARHYSSPWWTMDELGAGLTLRFRLNRRL